MKYHAINSRSVFIMEWKIMEQSDFINTVLNNGSQTNEVYGEPKLVYFAFIDVLGFKESFKDGSDEKFADVFAYYFDIVNASRILDARRSDWYAGQTSDTLYFYTEDINCLVEYIKIFSFFNLYAMQKDVFFRGGIARDNLRVKAEYQYYGKSVISAFCLEDEISNNPIITIDEATYTQMQQVVERSELDKLIKEKDHRFFLHPFYSKKLRKEDLELVSESSVRDFDENEIEKVIEGNIKKNEFNNHVYSKYLFLKKEFIGRK